MTERSSVNQLALGALLAVAAGTTGCASRANAGAVVSKPVVAIAVEPARSPADAAAFRGPGTAVAAHTYRLGFEITGRVTAVNADVGDRVSAGEVLAAIDDSDYREQLGAATARAGEAAAQAERADNGARPQERGQADESVAAARAQLARAQAAEDLARSNDARVRQLYASGDVAAQQADATRTALVDAESQTTAARAQLAAAEQSAALVHLGPRDEDRSAARAEAAAARASAELAATTLAKTVLRAPADAFVESRDVEPGTLAAPGAVAFVLTDAAPPDVIVNVPEARLEGIAAGTAAVVAFDGRRVAGRVSRVEPSADPATRTAAVRIRMDDRHLRPGAVVDVTLAPHRTTGADVPAAAVLSRDGRDAIFVYDAAHKTVRLRAVRVADAAGESVRLADVAPGTPVVVLGQHAVTPGDPVAVVEK